MQIEPGDRVHVRSAYGDLLPRRAMSGVEKGYDFPVVWVCTEAEWAEVGGEADGVPWPADAVQPARVVLGFSP